MKRAIFLAAFVLLGAGRAGAQGVDSCLALWQNIHPQPLTQGIPQDEADKENPDSAYFDTCQASATFGSMFCRNEYTLRFEWYVISTPYYPIDTPIVYRWTDIDTQFAAIRAAFQNLEDSVGSFTVTKYGAHIMDTGSRLSHTFSLRFDSLMNVDTARRFLNQVPNLDTRWNGMPRINASGGSSVNNLADHNQRVVAWPQPCSSEIIIEGVEKVATPEIMDMLGRQLVLPTRFVGDTTLHIDVTTVPSGMLFLRLPQQIIRIIVRK